MKTIVYLNVTAAEPPPCLEFLRVLIILLLRLWEIYILTQFLCSTEAVSLIGCKAVTNPQNTHTHSIEAGDAVPGSEEAFWIQ